MSQKYWKNALRNVEGRYNVVRLADIENYEKSLLHLGAQWEHIGHGEFQHVDIGTYDSSTGLLVGNTGRYYFVGQYSWQDLQEGHSVWSAPDIMGFDLGTSDYREAYRIVTEAQAKFNDVVAENRERRSQNEDRQVEDIQARVRAIEDYQRSQSAISNQNMTRLQKMYTKQFEDYNVNIESAFRNIGDLINSLQDSAQAPSTIQTLYLDRQERTYLPTSIRNRGIAGVMGGGNE